MCIGKRDYRSREQTLLVFLILNGTVKTKLAIFLCFGEIVQNSIAMCIWLHLFVDSMNVQ